MGRNRHRGSFLFPIRCYELTGLIAKIVRLPQAVEFIRYLRVQRYRTGSSGGDDDAVQCCYREEKLRVANVPRPGVLDNRSRNPSKCELGTSYLTGFQLRKGSIAIA